MRYLFYLSLILTFSSQINAQASIDISGLWSYRLDHDDLGESERWFDSELGEKLTLPGSLATNGRGDDITMETLWTGGVQNKEWPKDSAYAPYHDPENVRFPFWLQPDKRYYGAAWYQKKVIIPENWSEKTITLNLERCHWETTVWVNDQKVGTENSLGTPHRYDLSKFISPGEAIISIRVDNRVKEIDPGENSHSISDHTQSNWNGIVGKISLDVSDLVSFDDVQVFSDIPKRQITIHTQIVSKLEEVLTAKLRLKAESTNGLHKARESIREISIEPGMNAINLTYGMGSGALLWDEFSPSIYQLSLGLESKGVTVEKQVDFGLRDFKIEGTRFAVNGRPIFLRGTLECAIFPKTGYPATDVAEWKRIYTVIKSHGLNHMRFHSWCPPEAAFSAADELGIYLQVECSSWANQSSSIGDGKPIDTFIQDESERIVKEYGNHPSFVMMTYGNEPAGKNMVPYLRNFVTSWKNKDNRRIYTAGAGWPQVDFNDYHNSPQPRIQGWGEQLKSVINAEPPKTNYDWWSRNKMPDDGKPVVSHEIGQWCVYPNFKEMTKYTGPLKPRNFEIFKESLEAHNMGNMADSFLMASGKLQTLCYKADIEAALRTKDFGGFQLLDLHDFPGQGTALIGVLDSFWEEKGYVSPEEYRRFCNSVVPLTRLEKRVFEEGEQLVAQVEVANFGASPLLSENPSWKLIGQGGDIIAEGTLGTRDIVIGNGIELGTVQYTFPKENNPRKLALEVDVAGYSNSWDIWVYPPVREENVNGIKHVTSLDKSTIKKLLKGGTVLLSLGKGKIADGMGGEVGVGFSSIFWNTAWTNGQKPHTLGILCDPGHPALAQFPTEYHSNWQWWDAMSHSDAILLDEFPADLKPVVQVIDDWVTNRKLALLVEVKVGKGKLMISGVDLINDMESRLEARQLLTSILNYMSGASFNPTVELDIDQVKGILR